MTDDEDVPLRVDFRDAATARTWTEETPKKRPYRVNFFTAFCTALPARSTPPRVPELGSGPGHLAREIVSRCQIASYLALDWAEPMHALAREHLGELAPRVTQVTRDFRSDTWSEGLGTFDAVVTLQAVHELRHRRHMPRLLGQILPLLVPGGVLLYADHYRTEDSPLPGLSWSRDEQLAVLRAAQFASVERIYEEGSMALYAATR
ncbi:MAG TPA: class I SAM-dependent methyltransferase [Kofleriaceae bacterium]|nr:class I SAM-dependent methyltransferase [Kofleriaceae bacterium]